MLQNQIKDKCTKYFLQKNGWPISLDLQIEHICRQPVGQWPCFKSKHKFKFEKK